MAYNHLLIFKELDAALSQSANLKLGRFAEGIHIDRHTIEKAVRSATSKSFREYKRQRLLKDARRMLIEEFNLSEKEIAFRLGYASRDAFCRFIKINTGKCPGKIRHVSG